MVDELIMAGVWLVLALFFMFLNTKLRSDLSKFLSYWAMASASVFAVIFVVRMTLEVYHGS